MRKLVLFLAIVLSACGGNDNAITAVLDSVQHVPEISNFEVSPQSAIFMEGDGSVVATAEVTFRDAGRDIQTLWIRMPDGTSIEFSESPATETGTFTENFDLPTDQAGAFIVEIWLVDSAGASSVHREADFYVIGEAQNSAGGIWKGFILNDRTGESFELHGVITEDNVEGRFLINGATLFVLKDISADGGGIVATISVSIRPDSQIVAEQWQNLGVLTGTLVERTRIQGEWSLDSGDFGAMVLEYDDLYERGSDIAKLAGTWKASWGTVYSIDALGELFGQSESSCVYTGQVQLIDATYNVYRVNVEDWCLAYTASGLGVLADEVVTDDAFALLVGEGWFIADTWQRQ